MAERKRRGGPQPGYRLKRPRKAITKHPDTSMVPDFVHGNAQRGAWKKGWLAAAAGKTERANPYSNKNATFARGLYYLWLQGYDTAKTPAYLSSQQES